LWAKTKLAFAQAYFDYGSEIDWFLKVQTEILQDHTARKFETNIPRNETVRGLVPNSYTFMFL
jgi:hypothetical protein